MGVRGAARSFGRNNKVKKLMFVFFAVVAVLALAATVYIVGVLREGSDAIPINELEQEYIGDSFDGEFDHCW